VTIQLRNEVAAALERLSAPGQPLAVDAEGSTWQRYGDSLKRVRLWKDFAESWLEDATTKNRASGTLVVTSGAPGAGKSTFINAPADTVQVDADAVKKTLIEHEIARGSFGELLEIELPDGRPVMPAELSGLVHD
jgi:hypothetical protein